VTHTTILTLVEVLIFSAKDIATGFKEILLGITAEWAPKIKQVFFFLGEPV
jgi:hypothetical protein